ncbi:MAG: diguanylate cyclase [Burkholderiaceae bacterium]|nr:diguanylate cyclase [Burkholderiaceae bacterium]
MSAPRSFRAQLALWFGSLSLMTLLSVGLYVGWLSTQKMASVAGESLHAAASAAADLLAVNLRERQLELALLSQAPHFTRGDLAHPDLLVSLQQRLQLRSEFAWLGVADIQGQVVQATNGLLQGMSVVQRPWFAAGLKGVYVGDVHEALLLGQLLPVSEQKEPPRFLDFAAPIRTLQGQVVGVVVAHAHWRWVTDVIDAVIRRKGLDAGTQILILDQRGSVLYPQSLLGQTRPAALGADPARPFAPVVWGDGQTYLTSEVAVQALADNLLGWRVVARQPLAVALAPVDALRNRLLVLGFAAALVFTLLAWRLAKSVSGPIEQLAWAARQIERREGTPAFPAAGRVREVAQLSQSIQSMTATLLLREAELQALNQSLEQQVMQRTDALTVANLQLEQLATNDALTGLNNRRRFDEKLKECGLLGLRTGRGFSVLLIDVDFFKQVNDALGHLAGDQVLQQLAQLLTKHIRATDFVARYGGEEFVVLLPESNNPADVQTAAEKVRAAVAAAHFPGAGSLTVSIGCSTWAAADSDLTDVVQRADAALYAAKSAGRNRVVSH